MTTIPGTGVPLCLCCEDEPAARGKDGAPIVDDALGPVCVDCIPALANATVALAEAGLLHPRRKPQPKAK
jgi:hypothetical protein